MPKITYKLRLNDIVDTSELKLDEKETLKNELGELLYDLILKDTSNQRSAVSGQRWKGLSKEYKKIKSKVAPGIANLELTGDMLDALEVRNYRDGVEIGVFDPVEALKAENHNKFTARAERTKLPKRQFIPKKDESFRPGIIRELTKLAEDIVNED